MEPSEPPRCRQCGQPAPQVEGVCLACVGQKMDTAFFGNAPLPTADEAALGVVPEVAGWEVQKLLGIGGMGQLWLGRQAVSGVRGVLKMVAPGTSEDVEQRFETEAEILSALEHPHILKVLDIATAADGRLCMITEYIAGCDLRRLLRAEKFTVERALDIFDKVSAAVAHAHTQGVVHRDLKPSNILVDSGNTVKVADFGLAKDLASTLPNRTSMGDGLGTPYYLAPELLQGASQADERADVYSLGVLLYEMLTGTVPLGTYAPISKLTDLPKAWDGVLRAALMQNREGRTANVATLRSTVARLGLAARKRRSWRKKGVYLAMVAGLAGSAVLGAVLTRPKPAPQIVFPAPEAASLTKPWKNSLGMAFLPIPGHPVLMGQYEVTIADMLEFRKHEEDVRPAYRRGLSSEKQIGVLTASGWVMVEKKSLSLPGFEMTPQHPAFGISAVDAQLFCSWLTIREQAEGRIGGKHVYRLPHVAEWRAVAEQIPASERNGNFAGPEAKDESWPAERAVGEVADLFPKSAPVGSSPAQFGFYDLFGNVAELAVPETAAATEDSPYVHNLSRIGGSWADAASQEIHESNTRNARAKAQRVDVGMRCVLDLGQTP